MVRALRICFVCSEYPPAPHGGVGTFVRDLSRGLVALGHSVVVVGVESCVDRTTVEDDCGVAVHRLPVSGYGRRAFVGDRRRLAAVVDDLGGEAGFDIVECDDGGGWSIFLDRKHRVVIRLHNPAPYLMRHSGGRRGHLLSLAETIAFRRATAICGVSGWVWGAQIEAYPLSGLAHREPRVIYNGVDLARFCPDASATRDPLRVVFAGTLKPQKGIEHLLAAFQSVLGEFPDAGLVMAGGEDHPGYLDELLSAQSYSERQTERVQWLGRVPVEEIVALYRSAGVCVFPSLAESFGLVAAEAMACGSAVVYTTRTAGPEVIHDGVSGLLVEPTDHPALARAMVRVLRDPSLAAQLGENGCREVQERFAFSRCTDETLAFYRQVIEHSI